MKLHVRNRYLARKINTFVINFDFFPQTFVILPNYSIGLFFLSIIDLYLFLTNYENEKINICN